MALFSRSSNYLLINQLSVFFKSIINYTITIFHQFFFEFLLDKIKDFLFLCWIIVLFGLVFEC